MKKRLLSLVLALCMVLALLPATAWAANDDFQIENGELIKYVGSESAVKIPDGVTKIGSEAFKNCTTLESVFIPNSVTEIGERSFYRCTTLTSITIPESVTEIGDESFFLCRSLTGITIPNGVTEIRERSFYGCTALTSITIPEGVTEIGDESFYECFSLTSVTIPDGVTKIGSAAFDNCTRLKDVSIPSSVAEIGSRSFFRCRLLTEITIPDGVTEIRESSFSGCTALTSITIPKSVTKIGKSSFSGCTALTSITIPESVTEIGESCFYGCKALTSITIPEGVKEIKYSVFYECTNLTNISIPNNVTKIGENSFSKCTALTSITIPESVTEIESGAFLDCTGLTEVTLPSRGVTLDGFSFRNTPWQKSFGDFFVIDNVLIAYQGTDDAVTVPSGITRIASHAFSHPPFEDTTITSVVLPKGVTKIDDAAFSGCYNLISIELPDTVTEIGKSAFSSCYNLISIAIPASVTTIGDHAFYQCENLSSVEIVNGDTQIGSEGAFHTGKEGATDPIEGLTIYAPRGGSVQEYCRENSIPLKSLSEAPEPGSVYRLKYQLNGGLGLPPETQSYVAGTSVTLPTTIPLCVGYSFQGWSDGTNTYKPGAKFIMPASNVVLTAQWQTETVYWLEYRLNGGLGTIPEMQSYAAGASVTLPTTVPTRNGYTFQGWSDRTNTYKPGAEFIMPASDVVLTAQWEKGSAAPLPGKASIISLSPANGSTARATVLDITFDQEIAESTSQKNLPVVNPNCSIPFQIRRMSDDRVVYVVNQFTTTTNFRYGANRKVLRINPTNASSQMEPNTQYYVLMGSDFVHFANGSTGPEIKKGDWVFTTDSSHTGNGTIHYSLTYQLDGGSGNFPPLALYAQGIAVVLPEPTRQNYNFLGWSDGTNTYQAGDTFHMPEQDVVLTAQWKLKVEPQVIYVQNLTKYSLVHVEEDIRTKIQDALYNLLFKAEFRPIKGPAVEGISVPFTGTNAVNATFPVQNKDPFSNHVSDSVLDPVPKFNERAAGCMAYALFATAYVYGTSGQKTTCNDLSAAGITTFIHDYADPGEHLRYQRSDKSMHSIVFLGESADGKGFYFISYGGGQYPGHSTNHTIEVDYWRYNAFAKEAARSLAVRDTNHGSYYKGSAKTDTKTIERVIVRLDCPVEATVAYNGETLDSRSPGSTSFGTVTRDGEAIIFDMKYNSDYDMNILGTGNGEMTLTLDYFDDNNELADSRKFVDVPIESSTEISSSGFDHQASFVLYITTDKAEQISTWGAGTNETIHAADEDYSSVNNRADSVSTDNTSSSTSGNHHSSGSSGGSGSSGSTRFSVSISTPSNGKVIASNTSASRGTTVTLTATPDAGYKLTSLVVKDSSGTELTLKDNGNNKYTFTMPNSAVSVNTVFSSVDNTLAQQPETTPATIHFTDVPNSAYYYDAVRWAVGQSITTGTTATTFSPDHPCTRAQAVTFLWRAAGSPAPQSIDNSFTDVQASAYYYDAILWAVKQGITTGTSANTFSPDETVTRSQTVAFLYRAAGSPAVSGNSPFHDVTRSAYYANAVQWAVAQGITIGTSTTAFSPNHNCTRAQIATFLYRNRVNYQNSQRS